jgi:dienelactone hydrolase
MRFGVLFAFLALGVGSGWAEEPMSSQGKARFTPPASEDQVPQRYRLPAQDFDWQMKPIKSLPIAGVEVFAVTFPSPVTTKYPENNTVHAEFYRPQVEGKFPCVIVLDITGGDQTLSRVISRHLAQNGIGALFVQMAYYGPRRPKNASVRLLSPDVDQTIEGVRQTVLDLRWATAWMESQPNVDPRRMGIMGTSLGSFVAALTAEMDPKLSRVCVMLGGGGFVDAYWDHPLVIPIRNVYSTLGGSKQKVKEWIAPIDPITCAANLRDRKVLIVGAKKDEIVPPRMAEALWEATGKQRIIWLDAGHYTAALYFVSGMRSVVEHFKE